MFGFSSQATEKHRKSIHRFRRARSGSVAIIFSLSVIPLLLGVGAAVDYSNALRIRAKLQTAVDSAALAAAMTQPSPTDVNFWNNAFNSAVDTCGGWGGANVNLWAFFSCVNAAYDELTRTGPAKEAAKRYVKTQMASVPNIDEPVVTVTMDTNSVVNVYASTKQNTLVMKAFGKDAVTVGAKAEAMRGSGKLEVALVLDTTGSMSGAKLTTLKSAATQLVYDIYALPQAMSRVKISLVPFAKYVNIGTAQKGAAWLSGSEDLPVAVPAHCDNTYPNRTYNDPYWVNKVCYNDGSPYDCSYMAYATIVDGAAVQVCYPDTVRTDRWYGCVGSRAYPLDLSADVNASNPVPAFRETTCSQQLVRLTSSYWNVISGISTLTASGETYIPAGLLWGWRTLSPNLPFADGNATSEDLQKIIVMMTDGMNTLSPSYPQHDGTDAATANTLTAQTCANIKAEGIRIYSVAFSVTDPTIKNVLRSCASSPDNFYDAATTSDLTDAFTRIGKMISAVRLSK